MVETLLAIVVLVAKVLLDVYSVTGIVAGTLYNLSPKYRRYVDTLMGHPWEDGV